MVASTTPGPDDGIVRVTLNTVYQKQLEASVDTAEIKGTLLLVSQNMQQVIAIGQDHEQRLRELERAAAAKADLERVAARVDTLDANVLTRTGMYAFLGVAVAVCGALATFLSLAIK
jgi:hypothetical protein